MIKIRVKVTHPQENILVIASKYQSALSLYHDTDDPYVCRYYAVMLTEACCLQNAFIRVIFSYYLHAVRHLHNYLSIALTYIQCKQARIPDQFPPFYGNRSDFLK